MLRWRETRVRTSIPCDRNALVVPESSLASYESHRRRRRPSNRCATATGKAVPAGRHRKESTQGRPSSSCECIPRLSPMLDVQKDSEDVRSSAVRREATPV